jgi:hypothetical protein
MNSSVCVCDTLCALCRPQLQPFSGSILLASQPCAACSKFAPSWCRCAASIAQASLARCFTSPTCHRDDPSGPAPYTHRPP